MVQSPEHLEVICVDARERMLYIAARRHYVDGVTMGTVAEELGVSRPTVSRLLARAREQGIVRITLAEPPGTDSPTARMLADTFGVTARIIPVEDAVPARARLDAVAAEAADVLVGLVHDDSALGVAWGVTTAQIARKLRMSPHSGVRVVQLNGSAHAHEVTVPHAGSLLQTYAAAFGGATVVPFPIPTFFDRASTKEAMWQERAVRNVLDEIARLDVAVFGVGYPHARVPSHVYAAGYIDPDDLAEALRAGAVGDVCTVLLRADGSYEGIALNDRATGPTPDVMRGICRRLGVVGDPSRAIALLAALRSGVMTDLVMDSVTARVLVRTMERADERAFNHT